MSEPILKALRTNAELSFYGKAVTLLWVIMHVGLLIFAIPNLLRQPLLLFVGLIMTLIDLTLILHPFDADGKKQTKN